MKKIRIGTGAGYSGDRIEPAVELIEKGNLDYIIFECLAERTIAIAQKEKLKDKTKGYNPFLEERMLKVLKIAKEKNVKIITNMGAANPKAAMLKTAEIAKQLGIRNLKISAVYGDDISHNIDKYYDYEILENNKALKFLKDKIISSNVYMGCEGIVKALEECADIIITGRVADPSLVMGPLLYEFGWKQNDRNKIGQAVLAGHLLECAGQVTGGYFADPGYKEVPDLHLLGFPYIEIDENADFFITKVDGSGGIVSEQTCKEQLLYEIHNPHNYITPDASADFSKVQFKQLEKNKVKAFGASSHGKPDTLKVSVGYKDCFIGEGEISYGGTNAFNRAKLAADIIEKRLKLIKAEIEEYRVDFIGYNSLFRDIISNKITDLKFPEIRLRVSARTKDYKNARLIGNELEALYTNGPAGGSGVRTYTEEVVSICSIFIPKSEVKYIVDFMEV